MICVLPLYGASSKKKRGTTFIKPWTKLVMRSGFIWFCWGSGDFWVPGSHGFPLPTFAVRFHFVVMYQIPVPQPKSLRKWLGSAKVKQLSRCISEAWLESSNLWPEIIDLDHLRINTQPSLKGHCWYPLVVKHGNGQSPMNGGVDRKITYK